MTKLRNTTDYPDWFLRRMIGWICRHKAVGYKVKEVWTATFRNSRHDFSGRAWPSHGRFHISVGNVTDPRQKVRALVSITAHEIGHLQQERAVLRGRYCEADAEHIAKQVTETFVEKLDELVERWMAPPAYASRPKKPKPPVQQQRYERAKKNLANWEKKQKLAATKTKKYRKQVRYYEKALGVEPEAKKGK